MIEKYVENFRYAFIYENYLAIVHREDKIDLKDLYYSFDFNNDIRRSIFTNVSEYTDYQEAFIKPSLSQYERERFELIKKFNFGYLVKFK